MEWVRPSGKRLPAVTAAPGPRPSSERQLLSQARLDRICQPTTVYHEHFFRWFLRLADQATYPAAELKRRLEDDLGPEVCRLRVTVARPPAGMTGGEWEALEDRLQRKQAQADAITRVLESRQGTAPRRASRSTTSPLPAPVPASSGSAAECSTDWDPFMDA